MCESTTLAYTPTIRVLGVAPTFCTTEGDIAALAQLAERVREEISATLTSLLGRVKPRPC